MSIQLSVSRTDGNAPVSGDATTTDGGVDRAAASKAKSAAKRVPMSVDVLARHCGRIIARIDSRTIPALNKQYAKAKSTRERAAYRLRMILLKRGVAKIAVDDAFISSIAVQQEQKIRPARIAWYDGRAKLMPVRPTEIVVERKRGKAIPAIRVAQKGFARVCPACKPNAPTPHFVRHCEAHA